jgi:hypothetical protein
LEIFLRDFRCGDRLKNWEPAFTRGGVVRGSGGNPVDGMALCACAPCSLAFTDCSFTTS